MVIRLLCVHLHKWEPLRSTTACAVSIHAACTPPINSTLPYNLKEKAKDMDKKNEFMRRAIELSEESVRTGGGPFGAVIVRGDEIIAEASNSVTIDNDPTAHAEVNCIRKATRRLGTFDRKDAAAIGFDDDFIYQEIPLKPEQRHKTMQRLMGMEALKAFRMWEESADKTEY